MRLATWNVNSVKARLPRLLEWLDEAKPDIVCLQEIKTTTALFPETEVNELGYEVAAHGEGRWNGVALLSSVGLEQVSLGFPGAPSYEGEHDDLTLIDEPGLRQPEARAVGANCGGIRVWSLYAPNGRTPGSAHYAYKLEWFAALRTALEAELTHEPQLAACGDFNVAPTDDDVWDPAVFVHSTHVTPPERQALADLRALGHHVGEAERAEVGQRLPLGRRDVSGVHEHRRVPYVVVGWRHVEVAARRQLGVLG